MHGAEVLGLAGDAFGVEGLHEQLARKPAEGLGVVAQHEEVIGGAGGEGVLAAGCDALKVVQQAGQVTAVGVAAGGLLIQP